MKGEIELANNEDLCDHLKTITSSNTQSELTHLIPGGCGLYQTQSCI